MNIENKKKINTVIFITCLVNILLFTLGVNGIGNDIWGFLTGNGKFGDFNIDIIFDVVKTHPRPNDSGQFPAFDIIYTKFFDPYKYLLLASNILIGVCIPLYLIYKLSSEKYILGLYVVIIIITSYPFLFAFYRANPILGSTLWCTFGVFCFLDNKNRRSIFSITLASLIHPTAGIFCLIFIRDGLKNFLLSLFLIIFSQLLCYYLINYDLVSTLYNQFSSLERYKTDYVFGNYGDLYNNSLFILAKIIFYKHQSFLHLFLSTAPLVLAMIILIQGIRITKAYGFKSFCNSMAIYYLPIWVILSTGVAADYRLLYLNIPIVFMLINNYYKLPLFLLIFACLPKHFLFFSSYWLGLHPNALLVYPSLPAITGVGVTLNSLINPAILLIALLLPIDSLTQKFNKNFLS